MSSISCTHIFFVVFIDLCVISLLGQAVLSRAELLLESGCSDTSALEAASAAIDAVVGAWARLEAEEAEKKRKEAEIIKYKMQEHSVRPCVHLPYSFATPKFQAC